MLAISNDEFANLVAQYSSLIRILAKKYYLPGGDREDIVQEGLMGLYKAARDYNPNGKTSFRSFAAMVIERQMITALKTANRGKTQVLTRAVRFEYHMQEERYGHVKEFGDLVVNAAPDPLMIIIDAEETGTVISRLRKALSSLEMEVLKCRIIGYSIRETAAALSCSPKAVDNALSRIKSKFRAASEALKKERTS